MVNKKVIGIIIGVALIIVGIAAVVYAQNEISSGWEYTWTQPYSDYETSIITIKNVGIGSLIFGIADIVIIGFYKLFKNN